ncbi:hypothetical protein Q1695_009677 [Nippostrongylus brasiliensis]|nr:hypothetical protein Q1695_009677 [Nippostrongylus brasiliensis]
MESSLENFGMDEYGTEMWVEFQETPIATWWTIGLPDHYMVRVCVYPPKNTPGIRTILRIVEAPQIMLANDSDRSSKLDMVLAVVVLCAFLYFSVRRNVDTTQVASKEHLDTIKTVKWHLEEELAAEAKKYLKNVEDAQKRKRKSDQRSEQRAKLSKEGKENKLGPPQDEKTPDAAKPSGVSADKNKEEEKPEKVEVIEKETAAASKKEEKKVDAASPKKEEKVVEDAAPKAEGKTPPPEAKQKETAETPKAEEKKEEKAVQDTPKVKGKTPPPEAKQKEAAGTPEAQEKKEEKAVQDTPKVVGKTPPPDTKQKETAGTPRKEEKIAQGAPKVAGRALPPVTKPRETTGAAKAPGKEKAPQAPKVKEMVLAPKRKSQENKGKLKKSKEAVGKKMKGK